MADEQHLGDTITLQREAVNLIVAALRDLKEEDGQSPTASRVRLRMSELSYGGFSLGRIGLKRFRDLVDLARSEGLIEVDQGSAGDIRLSLPGDADDAGSAAAAFHTAVWRAMVDWRPDMLRLWDRTRGRAHYFPKDPVPLEPERFAGLREELREHPDNFLDLPYFGVEDQVDLLGRFAKTRLALHADQVSLFAAALDSSRPIQRGLQLLRDLDEAATTEWSRVLRRAVRERLEKWTTSTAGAPQMDELTQTVTSEPPLPIEEIRRRPKDEASAILSLRTAVHHAVDNLSPEELRALPMPAGVLFR